MRKLILMGLAAALASCGKPPEAQMNVMPPPAVVLAAPVQKRVSEWDEFSGRVDAVESVEIRPRVSGHITEVKIHSGQLVKKGDILFQIDPRVPQAALKLAEANLEQAKARLESATLEANRVKGLVAAKAISTEDAESRRTTLNAAQAAVHATEAARDAATLELEFTTVKSPIDGRVSRALQTEGNYISGVAGFTTLLTTVVGVDPVYFYAAVDEASFLKYQRLIAGKKLASARDGAVAAELRLDGETGYPHKGVIESFDNKLDPATGSVVLRLKFSNPDGILVPGLFGRVRVPGSAPYDALLVDEKVIQTDQSQKFVLVADEKNLAGRRVIKLGPMIDGLRVVREGIEKTDRIITTNLQMVRPDGPVMPLPAAAPAGK